MNLRRQQQLWYILADLISSELVWICFLGFRWMVYEGRVELLNDVLIPAFSLWRPLVIYPFVCFGVYYLSGYYLRPFQKPLWREFFRTLTSAAIIALIFFFAIIIDDQVDSYYRYLVSLGVLFGLQFVLSYLPRVTITLLTRHRGVKRVVTIHNDEEADKLVRGEQDEVILDLPTSYTNAQLYALIAKLYPLTCEMSMVPRVYDMLTGAARIGYVDSPSLIRITEHRMKDYEVCVKRAFDVVASTIGLILLSPLFAVIALQVKLSSPGPVIYHIHPLLSHILPNPQHVHHHRMNNMIEWMVNEDTIQLNIDNYHLYIQSLNHIPPSPQSSHPHTPPHMIFPQSLLSPIHLHMCNFHHILHPQPHILHHLSSFHHHILRNNPLNDQNTIPSYTHILCIPSLQSHILHIKIKKCEPYFITTYINTANEYVIKPLNQDFVDYLYDVPRTNWAKYIERRIKINKDATKDLIEWQ